MRSRLALAAASTSYPRAPAAYMKKNQVNHQRQESGYAVKDQADSRHI
jgi:hypothetical protein